jgi:hypothetical protein
MGQSGQALRRAVPDDSGTLELSAEQRTNGDGVQETPRTGPRLRSHETQTCRLLAVNVGDE